MNTRVSATAPGVRTRITQLIDWVTSPVGLFVLYVVIYLLPLGVRPLGIPDEMRYAEIPREMLFSGDWLVTRLNGLLYFEKPPLGYWLNALSIALLGENPLAVRLPGALAAGVTVLAMRHLMSTANVSKRATNFACFVYLSCLGVVFIGTYALLDTLFTLFLTLSLIFFYRAASAPNRQQQILLFVSSGLAAGLGFLTKGFLAVVIPGMVLLPWMVWSGNWQIPLRRLWLVMLGTLVVVVPWAVAVHLSAPDFWRYFVVVEHLNRFAGEQAQHEEPFYFYAFAIPLLLFPWILQFAGVFLARPESALELDNHQSLVKLLVCWSVLPLLFFSISKGKLPTYILPCVMPVIVLFALRCNTRQGALEVRYLRAASRLLVVLLVVLMLAFLLVQFTNLGPDIYNADEFASLLVMLMALCSACGLASLACNTPEARSRQVLMGLSTLPIYLAYALALPGAVIDSKAPSGFLLQFRDIVSAETIIVSDSSMFHAVAWTFRRQDLYMLSGGEVSYGLSQPDAVGRLLDEQGIAQRKSTLQPGQNMVVFIRNTMPESLTRATTEKDAVHQQGKFHAVVFATHD